MKKTIILAIMVAALAVSCEDFFMAEVTVRNNCGFAINAAVTQSQSVPSSYTFIDSGSSATFSGLENGSYYPHVQRAGSSGHATKDSPISVSGSETWTITYDSGFVVSYPQ